MNKYGQYCPTARAAEILGDRWTLLIVRDLLLGAQHFNQLERGLPGIPRALLAERLSRLQQVGVLERHAAPRGRRTRYELTQAGKELWPVIEQRTQWGAMWAFGEPEVVELDPVLLMWWMRARILREPRPSRRLVVEFAFRGVKKGRFWLVLSADDISVCLTPPGYDSDAIVTAELTALYQVWLGRTTLTEALRDRRIELSGTPTLTRLCSRWLTLGPAAKIVLAAKRRQLQP